MSRQWGTRTVLDDWSDSNHLLGWLALFMFTNRSFSSHVLCMDTLSKTLTSPAFNCNPFVHSSPAKKREGYLQLNIHGARVQNSCIQKKKKRLFRQHSPKHQKLHGHGFSSPSGISGFGLSLPPFCKCHIFCLIPSSSQWKASLEQVGAKMVASWCWCQACPPPGIIDTASLHTNMFPTNNPQCCAQTWTLPIGAWTLNPPPGQSSSSHFSLSGAAGRRVLSHSFTWKPKFPATSKSIIFGGKGVGGCVCVCVCVCHPCFEVFRDFRSEWRNGASL